MYYSIVDERRRAGFDLEGRGGVVSRSRISEGVKSPNLGRYAKFSTAVKSNSCRMVRKMYVPSLVEVTQLEM